MRAVSSFLFAVAISVAAPSQAEIRETDAMAPVFAAVDAETLLIFDLDNTVMRPVQMLGTDQWFDHLVKKYVAEGRAQEQAIDAAIELWSTVQKATTMVPVETVTPAMIDKMQKQGVKVMALTARPLDLIDATLRQLASIGVDFTKSAAVDRDLNLRSDDVARFEGGILFVGPKNNKGLTLSRFFEATAFRPKRIVFADDKSKHVNNMEAAMAVAGIPYLGFRYGAADEEVARFSPAVADVQLRAFEGILSDADAQAIIRCK